MKKLSLIQQLRYLAIFSAALLVLISGLLFYNLVNVAKVMNGLADTGVPSTRLMTLIDMMHDGIRAVVYSGLYADSKGSYSFEETEKEYQEFSDNINTYFKELKALPHSKELEANYKVTEPKVLSYVEMGWQVLKHLKAKEKEKIPEDLAKFMQAFEDLEAELGLVGESIESEAQKLVDASEKFKNTDQVVSFGFTFVIFLAGLSYVISHFVNRNIAAELGSMTKVIGSGAQHLKSSSGELIEISGELSSAAQEQAAGVQQTASAIHEITSLSEKAGEHTKVLKETMTRTNTTINEGMGNMEKMVDAMQELRKYFEEMTNQIEMNNTEMGEILKVLSDISAKTNQINDIVFQTKLLAFNASVEAARAGEHGKGFAVVAQEVGLLATQSGSTSTEIKAILDSGLAKSKDIIEKTRNSMNLMGERTRQMVDSGESMALSAHGSLQLIDAESQGLIMMIDDITRSVQEQIVGVREVSRAMQSFDEVAQKNSTMASHLANSAQGVQGETQNLDQSVADLNRLAGVKT